MDSHFDVIILGTGLTESITAAALAKAGLRVAHLDSKPYYGAEEASLSMKELEKHITAPTDERNSYARLSSISLHGELPSSSRDYSLSLCPSIIPSTGPLISSLIGSGVAHYGGFKLLESVSIYSTSKFKSVPGSKEEIFKSKELSLLDKRRLMRFLMFASGEFETSTELQGKETMPFISFLEEVFSLNKQLAFALAFALALCTTNSDPTLLALKRIKHYLRSAGRYGSSPFLVGQYGGLGELAQGFCRVCAVSGGTYILGRDILSLETKQRSSSGTDETKNFRLRLSDIPEDLSADIIISSVHFLHLFQFANEPEPASDSAEERHAYGITIVDGTISQPQATSSASAGDGTNELPEVPDEGDEGPSRPVDATLLVFPPGALPSGSASGPVNVFINGEGTLSCPRGKSLLYLSTPVIDTSVDPESLLRPYLETTLSLLHTTDGSFPKELSSIFYARSSRPASQTLLTSLKEKGILVSQVLQSHLAEAGDAAASNAEALFRDALRLVGRTDVEDVELWPPLPVGMNDDDGDDMF